MPRIFRKSMSPGRWTLRKGAHSEARCVGLWSCPTAVTYHADQCTDRSTKDHRFPVQRIRLEHARQARIGSGGPVSEGYKDQKSEDEQTGCDE